LIAQGTISASVEGFTVTQTTAPTALPGEPFTGRGDLILENTSSETVRFVVPEGLLMQPDNDASQRLVSHATNDAVDIPATGSASTDWLTTIGLPFVIGVAMICASLVLFMSGRMRRRRQA
jgi:hypothetical protein